MEINELHPKQFFHWLDAYCLGAVVTQQFLIDEWERMIKEIEEENNLRTEEN
jgi:hypothetical protein